MASIEGKETEGLSLCDRISELPNSVLLLILEFMDTKSAVRTCVWSNRWKDLWKSLTTLSFICSQFGRFYNFNDFVNGVLSSRHNSVPLLKLDLVFCDDLMSFFTGEIFLCRLNELELLNRVIEYALSHNCQYLTIDIELSFSSDYEFRPFIFSSPSLTYLKLSVGFLCPIWKVPNSLQLPVLQTLHLENVCFTASDNDNCATAEPFSSCKLLKALVLTNCSVDENVKVLNISNSNLSGLLLQYSFSISSYNIVLSTPNLRFLVVHFSDNHQLSSMSNLLLLEEVFIGAYFSKNSPVIISWLPMIANVNKIRLSVGFIKFISDVLSNPDSVETHPPCFVRLESLKLVVGPFRDVSDEQVNRNVSDDEVNRVVKFLLQNSPQTTIDVIRC